MKCIKKGDEVRRVKDQEAAELVAKGWKYCPKKEWKTPQSGQVKVVEAPEDQPEEVLDKKARWKAAKATKEVKESKDIL